MGTPKEPEPVKQIVAVTYTKEIAIDKLVSSLERRFGDIEISVGPLPFSWTDYYASEMGKDLLKRYLCFKNLVQRHTLPACKLWTNGIEQQWAVQGKRRVNIDPGYLSRDKLVLASTKDFYHRLHLAEGIYGEVTLHYRQNRLRHFSWTYPDYQEEAVQAMLLKARASLVGELRKSAGQRMV